MNRLGTCAIVAAALGIIPAAPGCAAEEAAPPEGAVKTVAVVAAGTLDAAVVNGVAEHLRSHLLVPCRVLPATAAAGAEDLEGEAKALAPLKTGDVEVLIGLVDAVDGVANHGAVFVEMGIGTINVTALSQGDPDDETFGRRMNTESLRAVALLTGSKPCPLPLCALWHYRTLEQMDRKGHNLCGPCRGTFMKNAEASGLIPAKKPTPAPAP